MTDRLTPAQVEEMQRRCDAATSGPWQLGYVDDTSASVESADALLICDLADLDDAAFIAHARTDVAALVSELRATQAERDALRRRDPLRLCAECHQPLSMHFDGEGYTVPDAERSYCTDTWVVPQFKEPAE